MLLNIFAIDDDEVASELMLHLFLMAYGCYLFTVIPHNPLEYEYGIAFGGSGNWSRPFSGNWSRSSSSSSSSVNSMPWMPALRFA